MNKKVLIIEDDMSISKILRIMLQKNGYEALAAFDAITGRSAILKNSPDLIILDISMPGGNGLEIAEYCSNHPKLCVIPIIVVTASANKEIKAKLEELGILAYIEKPFDVEKILGIIKKELDVSST